MKFFPMKNKRFVAPLIIPAELRLEEFASYFSALAKWVGKDPGNLEALFADYRASTNADDSTRDRLEFVSFLFWECTPGNNFLATLKRNRLSQQNPLKPN